MTEQEGMMLSVPGGSRSPLTPHIPLQSAVAPSMPTRAPACPTAHPAPTAAPGAPRTHPASAPAATTRATRARAARPTTAPPAPLPTPWMRTPTPAPLRRASPPRKGCTGTSSPSSSCSVRSRSSWPCCPVCSVLPGYVCCLAVQVAAGLGESETSLAHSHPYPSSK